MKTTKVMEYHHFNEIAHIRENTRLEEGHSVALRRPQSSIVLDLGIFIFPTSAKLPLDY